MAIPYTMKILIKFYNQIRLVKDYLYQLSVTIMIVVCNKRVKRSKYENLIEVDCAKNKMEILLALI